MGGSLTEVRRRLPSLQNLEHAATLLNLTGLDEADRNIGVPPHLQQAALLDRIADWAALSAKAAREDGELGFAGGPEPYAYVIEMANVHQANRRPVPADGPDSGGIEESADSPVTYAIAVMNRYLDHMRDHPVDYEDVLVGEFHVRVSVWRVRSVTAAHASMAPDPNECPPSRYGDVLKRARISPDAVENRTPLQVHNYVYGAVTV
jgi:hypothetical protein